MKQNSLAVSSTGRLTVETPIHFSTGRHTRDILVDGPAPPTTTPLGRLPRVARLMAVALHFDDLIRQGDVRDYADIARLGQVTRTRATQIMAMLNLAPDIQEELLSLSRTLEGRDILTERDLRSIVANGSWTKQRQMWKRMYQTSTRPSAASALTTCVADLKC